MYTLAEARQIILHDLCLERFGEHELEQEAVRSTSGTITILVFCARCGVRFTEETPHV